MLDEKKAAVKAASLIRESEGLRLVPYLCPAGFLSVGFGHRTDRRTAISMRDADEWLRMDIEIARRSISASVAARCNTNQFAALLSFIFNVGGMKFIGSTMHRLIIDGEMVRAGNQFLLWDKAHVAGELVRLPGLTIRREAERELFLCLRDL